MDKIKLKKFYNNFQPIIWISFGAIAVLVGTSGDTKIIQNLELLMNDDKTYKTADGKFACWWIDDVYASGIVDDEPEFTKELFALEKKYCVDMPRPNNDKIIGLK